MPLLSVAPGTKPLEALIDNPPVLQYMQYARYTLTSTADLNPPTTITISGYGGGGWETPHIPNVTIGTKVITVPGNQVVDSYWPLRVTYQSGDEYGYGSRFGGFTVNGTQRYASQANGVYSSGTSLPNLTYEYVPEPYYAWRSGAFPGYWNSAREKTGIEIEYPYEPSNIDTVIIGVFSHIGSTNMWYLWYEGSGDPLYEPDWTDYLSYHAWDGRITCDISCEYYTTGSSGPTERLQATGITVSNTEEKNLNTIFPSLSAKTKIYLWVDKVYWTCSGTNISVPNMGTVSWNVDWGTKDYAAEDPTYSDTRRRYTIGTNY